MFMDLEAMDAVPNMTEHILAQQQFRLWWD
jgi:hypothetical protein